MNHEVDDTFGHHKHYDNERKDKRKLRNICAYGSFILFVVYLVISVVFIIFQHKIGISDNVIIAFLITNVTNIFSILFIIAKFLFK